MTKGFIIAEYEDIKKSFPEFTAWAAALRAKTIAQAAAAWAPMTFGGFAPKGKLNQFGETTILPPLFVGQPGAQLVTWNQVFTATGAQTILTGFNSGLIPEDFYLGVIGFMFADKAIRLSELRFQLGDSKYIRVNIEEVKAYEKPAIVFEEGGFVVPEEQGFDVLGYVETRGQQRLIPLGIQLNKVPNKTQVTNCGASLGV